MEKEHCCELNCTKDAEWEIYADGVPDTAACTEHVGELLTDAKEHRIFRIKQEPCCNSPSKDKCEQCQEIGLANPNNH